MMMQKPLAIIAGAGAGLGQALYARLEKGGFEAAAPSGHFHALDLANTKMATVAIHLNPRIGTTPCIQRVLNNGGAFA